MGISSILQCCYSMWFCGLQRELAMPLVIRCVSPECPGGESWHGVQAMAVVHYTLSGKGECNNFFAEVLFGSGGTLQGNHRNGEKMVAVTLPSVSYILTYGSNLQSKIRHRLHMPDACGS